MARDGSGVYTLPQPAFVGGTVISSTAVNSDLSDIGTALTQSIAKDGQTTPTANLPMGGLKHTGVGNSTARTQYAAAGQVQDGGLVTLGAVAGTNAITASATPAITAYALGQKFSFLPAAANTGAVTIAINGLAAKAITKFGTDPLVAGDLPIAATEIFYDGTQFQLTSVSSGMIATQVQSSKLRLIDAQIFTATGTWTKPSGTSAVDAEVIGGGGGSSGADADASEWLVGGGGGGGGYSRKFISASLGATEAVTVGAGGAAGTAANGAGGNGATSSFGAHLSATGGTGGSASSSGPATTVHIGTGRTAGVGSGGDLNISGGSAGIAIRTGSIGTRGGPGGGTPLAGIAAPADSDAAAGVAGKFPGGGAAGASSSGAAFAGAAGAAGVVIVRSYGL